VKDQEKLGKEGAVRVLSAQNECWAIAVVKVNHTTASGTSAQAAIVTARWYRSERKPRTRIVAAAANSTHCPTPPAVTHACAAAHGAQEPEVQLNWSVQVEPIPNPAPNQPSVPSKNATTNVAVPASAATRLGQFLRLLLDGAFMWSLFYKRDCGT
jgi:hypothetical protein